jgi:hypothetical protein
MKIKELPTAWYSSGSFQQQGHGRFTMRRYHSVEVAFAMREDARQFMFRLSEQGISTPVDSDPICHEIELMGRASAELARLGICPWCNQHVRAWQFPIGEYGPAMRQRLSEIGVDWQSGHKVHCPHQDWTPPA